MNILVFDFGSYMTCDLLFFLQNAGYRCEYLRHDISGQQAYHDETFENIIGKILRDNRFDAVVSSNFFPVIGRICYRFGVKYLAWSCDAPMNLPTEEGFDYPTNYIFLFDRGDYLRYRKKGLDTVYHLPLAVNCERLRSGAPVKNPAFTCDVSFLGVLYASTLPVLKAKMPDYERGFIDAVVGAQADLYGAWLVDELLTEERMDAINRHYKSLSATAMQITAAQLSYAIATHITHRDRLSILKLLSERYDVLLCSDPLTEVEAGILSKVRAHGRIDYMKEMPQLFTASKINLNATLRCIKTGIPLRVLDIMGSGGFVLSNYQEEIAEYLTPGEDLAVYDSVADALEKAEYYLKNEEERKRISENGFARMKRDFRYEDRIAEMFKTARL